MDYWIKATDGQTYGPASPTTMNKWIAEGRVIASTPVAYSPDGPWREATMVPELAAAFGLEPVDATGVPPTQPVPPSMAPGSWPPGMIAIPQLISGIFHLVCALSWVFTCFGIVLAVPLTILGIKELIAYSNARVTPPLQYLERTRTYAILDIVAALALNFGSVICGIIMLTQLDEARRRAGLR
jgi:hypothetical protein